MAKTGAEPIGSMGTDTPVAVLSDRPAAVRLLPAALRPGHQPAPRRHPRGAGHLAGLHHRPEGNLLDPTPASCRQVVLPNPILTNDELAKLLYINDDGDQPGFKPFAVDGLYPVAEGGEACAGRSTTSGPRCRRRSTTGPRSSSSATATRTPSWRRSRRCCSPRRVHHHLIREKTRTRVGLVVETGEAREVHHMALLLGYGAGAINPYLAFETIEDMIDEGPAGWASPSARRSATTSRPAARAC